MTTVLPRPRTRTALTVTEAAAEMGRSPELVRRMCRLGLLPARRTAHVWLIDATSGRSTGDPMSNTEAHNRMVLYRDAERLGVNAAALDDSVAFRTALVQLDPEDPLHGDRLANLVTTHADSNPGRFRSQAYLDAAAAQAQAAAQAAAPGNSDADVEQMRARFRQTSGGGAQPPDEAAAAADPHGVDAARLRYRETH